MPFCSACGAVTASQIPAGDNRPRQVCPACNTIHYENPKIIAGTLAHHDGKILLAKRAIEPRHGLWTLPAGFMECGESVEQAAQRETLEEAGATVAIEHLLLVASIPQIAQVYMLYQAQLTSDHAPGEESLETELFAETEIPWEQLAFPVIGQAIKLFYTPSSQQSGHQPSNVTHHTVIQRKKP